MRLIATAHGSIERRAGHREQKQGTFRRKREFFWIEQGIFVQFPPNSSRHALTLQSMVGSIGALPAEVFPSGRCRNARPSGTAPKKRGTER